jgi:16S rRNA processing protein RimM
MAEITGVHGIKGFVKLKVFSDDPEGLADYAPLCDSSGKRSFRLLSVQRHGNTWLAALEGVTDRTAAEKLRGTKLYLSRDQLPKLDARDTFYHADLIGLAAKTPAGKRLGAIIAVVNFGAGDLLEIKPAKGTSFYVPFSKAVVPDIDLAKGEATVDPPPGLLD